jgi:hypothetical protein
MYSSELNWLIKETISILDDISEHFCYWLDDVFVNYFSDSKYFSRVKSFINRSESERRLSACWNKITDLDFYTLLKLAERALSDFNLYRNYPPDFRSNIIQMKDIRHNLQGHKPVVGITFEKLEAQLVITDNFCSNINLDETRRQRIRDLRNRASQYKLAEIGIIPAPGDKMNPGIGKAPAKIDKKPRLLFRDIFTDVNLTLSQIDAVDSLEKFLFDREKQCFILKGYAGTGKTFLIGALIKYLNEIHISSMVMAPTGRAARIIAERHNTNATTIHRAIYYVKNLKEYESVNDDGKPTFKYYYDLLNNDHEQGTVFIVDEASMISDFYNEDEFIRFGSGYLLKDLMTYINFDGNDNKKKIIFVGDTAQLPPVNMAYSPALDEEYLRRYFAINISSAILTDIVRQKKDSTILKVATSYRKAIDDNIYNQFNFIHDGNEVQKLTINELIPEYLRVIENKVDGDSILITYANSSAASYNKIIRSNIFPGKEEIMPGDRIIVVKNNYFAEIDIMNGQMGYVEDVDPTIEVFNIPLNTGKKEGGGKDVIFIKLTFRKMLLRFYDNQNKEHLLKLIVLENLLYNDQLGITSDESKALYVFFKQRNIGIKHNTEEFKNAIKSDPYFNALQIKFGYAITCHKSQGGSWKNVFVDFDGRNRLDKDSLRWCYTAVTRSEERLYAVNILNYSLLYPIKMKMVDYKELLKNIELIPIQQSQTESKQSANTTDFSIPENFQGDKDFMKALYLKIKSILPNEAIFIEDIHKDYLEQYKFHISGTTMIIKLNYSKKEYISYVQIQNKPDGFPEDIVNALNDLKGQAINNSNNTSISGLQQNISEDDANFQLFAEMEKIYSIYGVSFTINKMSDYHYQLRISDKDKFCDINYYMDSKNRLTSITPFDKVQSSEIYNKVLKIHFTNEIN